MRDLNKLMKLKGKARCCKGKISLLNECLTVGVPPKDAVKWIVNGQARHMLAMEKAFMSDDLNKEENQLRHLVREVNLGMCRA